MISKKFIFEACVLLSPLGLFFLWSTPSSSSVSSFTPVARFIKKASQEITEPLYYVFKKEEAPFKITFAKPKKAINWDLENTGLNADELEPFLEEKQPEKLVIYRGNKFAVLDPREKDVNARGVMFVSDKEAIDQVKNQRQQDMLAKSGGGGRAPGPDTVDLVKRERHNDMQSKMSGSSSNGENMGRQEYELQKFNPGFRDDHVSKMDVPSYASEAVYGPDFTLSGGELSENNRHTVLSLGHGGEVTLMVKGQGVIADDDGFDFSLYENPFRIAGVEPKYYQELALVGVAEVDEPSQYKWFECDPGSGILKGCMGVVPTSEGGDQFDLAQVGLKKAHFIKIKDIGINFDNRGSGTEGADLDAGSLSHGVVVK